MAQLLRTADAARRLGIDRKTLGRWRRAGRGPAWIGPEESPHLIRYDVADVDAWISQNRRAPRVPRRDD